MDYVVLKDVDRNFTRKIFICMYGENVAFFWLLSVCVCAPGGIMGKKKRSTRPNERQQKENGMK